MFSRFELLVGEDNIQKLNQSHVIVFGVGGVGGYVVEALVRSGIGHITIVDNDVVSLSNLNRQIIATQETIGQKKVDVMKKRILSIHPECDVTTLDMFYLPETADQIDLSQYDYVVDAIDTITSKIELAVRCDQKIPLISSMGTGNKMNPALLQVSDIYSQELPMKPFASDEITHKRTIPGSTAFVPSSAGLLIASEVVKDLLK